MIELTGLQLEQHKKIGALSKGYKQRVGMAQALMNNPKVLILDEPTSGLDPNQITEIRKLITNIGRERTVMLSTHIMQEVEAMCSRVLIINRGRLVADDSISNLQRQHGNKQSLQVKFKNGVDISHIKAIEGVIDVDDLGGYRYRIDAKTDLNLQEKLFNFAVETSNVLLEQKELEQSLESVFKSLTRNGYYFH
jgi:ABC-2 type transport system ATP-binding protein